jgi:hypothetical protein
LVSSSNFLDNEFELACIAIKSATIGRTLWRNRTERIKPHNSNEVRRETANWRLPAGMKTT